MLSLGSLTFLTPWILAGLLALPILWWLLRAIPPSPRTQTFPGVRLLLGLEDEERQTDKTPWWLLLLRCLAVAAALLGLAQPVMNLTERLSGAGGTVLVLMDQGWASAPEWDQRRATARAILDEAAEAGRQVVFWPAAEEGTPPTVAPEEARRTLDSTEPRPWAPRHGAVAEALAADDRGIGQTIWFHDGLTHEGTGELVSTLSALGPLRVIRAPQPPFALTPPRLEDGLLTADLLSTGALGPAQVVAFARADDGGERRIAVANVESEEDGRATFNFDLPPELQGTVTRIMLADRASAGGAALADGAIRRANAYLVAGAESGPVTTLTSATHYIEKALQPWANVTRAALSDALEADPGVIVLSDYADMAEDEREALTEWLQDGGLLIRFAGPRLAASIGAQGFGAIRVDDPLLPVRLRRGGRVLGGALAWTTPRALGRFGERSPFRGLVPPEEVDVRTQVLAEPDPGLSERTWASLDDGTPLVTAARREAGQVVLFHVSADAEWSSLPLSGLFVEMFGRLMSLAPGRGSGLPDAESLTDTVWRPDLLLAADGAPRIPGELDESVAGEAIAAGAIGADLPPGIYSRANRTASEEGEADSIVLNLIAADTELSPFPSFPASAVTETLGGIEAQRYGPLLLALAVLLIVADVIGTLVVSGRLRSRTVAATAVALIAVMAFGTLAQAQESDDSAAVAATAETTLGYVRTGDARIDEISERGIEGLRMELTRRTAIEPGPAVGVDPETDPLAFYPVLYMPLTAETLPTRGALEALNRYLQTGGMLIIDTQNGTSGFGGASAAQMREIARALNLPPLEPVDEDHVLTRTFYLLNSFPGRWNSGRIWTEASTDRGAENPEEADIPQFDRVDDNVSPVIVGSADWAAAWAIDERGYPMFPIGRPGDRQRELAIRFGVNAVMYALTGNYKSDQVHAPAVLRRLGQ